MSNILIKPKRSRMDILAALPKAMERRSEAGETLVLATSSSSSTLAVGPKVTVISGCILQITLLRHGERW